MKPTDRLGRRSASRRADKPFPSWAPNFLGGPLLDLEHPFSRFRESELVDGDCYTLAQMVLSTIGIENAEYLQASGGDHQAVRTSFGLLILDSTAGQPMFVFPEMNYQTIYKGENNDKDYENRHTIWGYIIS